MKLLLDECIDRKLAKEFSGYEIKTVPQMGWAGVKNGQLLTFAEAEFDVFITVDRNLPFQQNLPQFNMAVLVLQARTRSTKVNRAGLSSFLAHITGVVIASRIGSRNSATY